MAGGGLLWLPPFYDSPLRDGATTSAISTGCCRNSARSGLRRPARRGAPPRYPDHHRPGDEPHLRQPSVVSGVRRDPDGPYGDFYVERHQRSLPRRASSSSTPRTPTGPSTRYAAKFYWHRFFSHQPDLNYDNPAVQEAMIDVCGSGWTSASTAFDSTRCRISSSGRAPTARTSRDARLLKTCRRVVDDEFTGRVLLAEAEPVAGRCRRVFRRSCDRRDECHMAFHFPLMPRIFMAVRRESPVPDLGGPGIRRRSRRWPSGASSAQPR